MEELQILIETCREMGIEGRRLIDLKLMAVVGMIERGLLEQAVESLSFIGLDEVCKGSEQVLSCLAESLLDSGIVIDSGVDLTQIYGLEKKAN